MEADSLAQSVEMSAVPWPLLKLCFFFSVISNLLEMVLLAETARKDLSCAIILNQKCESLFTLSHRPPHCVVIVIDLDTRPAEKKHHT